jgi:hypothetical protein
VSSGLTASGLAARSGLLEEERVAQLVEHLTFNQEVLGSSPSALTKTLFAFVEFCCQLLPAGCTGGLFCTSDYIAQW